MAWTPSSKCWAQLLAWEIPGVKNVQKRRKLYLLNSVLKTPLLAGVGNPRNKSMQEEMVPCKGSPQDTTAACLWRAPKSPSLPGRLEAEAEQVLGGPGCGSSARAGGGGGGSK